MVVLLGNWRKKLYRIISGVVILLFLAGFLSLTFKLLYNNSSVFSGWFDDEHPQGNPMRVEEWLNGNKFNEGVESLVFKIQELEEKNK
jgi:hypothetical protein